MGDPVLLLKPGFNQADSFDSANLTPVIEPIITNEDGDDGLSIVSYSPDQQSFSIEGKDMSAIGKWQVGVRIGFREYPEFMTDCLTTVNVNFETVFFGDDVTD